MDDTQPSKASDAAATRKRRSSILKSQRPPRTPLSELEFNVATPTDTTKSRRVSFSHRTGIAEFITNEATTTWKNFYEEHHKSLESSGNEEAHASRQPVGHLGNHMFDQQFQEEAFDVMPSLDSGPHSSFNITQNRETNDAKLAAPNNDFELSVMTDHQSRVFGNEFTAPSMVEMSGRIDVTFSVVQKIGEEDDLDEIQRDLHRAPGVGMCQGPARARPNMSEFIELEFNTTHDARNTEDSNMSITDTVDNPKLQILSKSSSVNKKNSVSQDWVADKENIAVNPYATPRESANFALNDEPDQVLVFDGKRVTLQPDRDTNYRQTLLPNLLQDSPLRKSIVLNVDDDLPNFVDNPQPFRFEMSRTNSSFARNDLTAPINNLVTSKRHTILNNTGDMSITQASSSNRTMKSDNSRSVIYNAGNISMTPALPAQILTNTGNRTVTYDNDNGNLSITQAVPTNIYVNNKDQTKLFDDIEADMSITQAVPTNIIPDTTRRRTIVFEDETGNVSITEALPANIFQPGSTQEKRKTILFDDGDMSLTQAVPTNIILPQNATGRRQTIHYDDDNGDISVTQMAPANIILQDEKINVVDTEVFEDETGNVSITEALPANIFQPGSTQEKRKTILFDDGDMSLTQAVPTNIILPQNATGRRQTIHYDDDNGDISVTQMATANIILQDEKINVVDTENVLIVPDNIQEKRSVSVSINIIPDTTRRRTVVFEDDAGNLSITQALPANIFQPGSMQQEKRKSVLFDDGDMSLTQAMPTNIILPQIAAGKRQTIHFDDNNGEISVTQMVPANIILQDEKKNIVDTENVVILSDNMQGKRKSESVPTNIIPDSTRRRTVVFEDDDGNLSITQALPANIFQPGSTQEKRKSILFDDGNMSFTQVLPTNIVLPQKAARKRQTIHYDNSDISFTQTVPNNNENRTVVSTENMSMTQVLPVNIISRETSRQIVYENDTINVSITQAVPTNIKQVNMNQNDTQPNDEVIMKDDKINVEEAVANYKTVITEEGDEKVKVFGNDDRKIPTSKMLPLNMLLDNVDSGSEQNIMETKEDEENINKISLSNNSKLTVLFGNEDKDAEMSIIESVNALIDVVTEKYTINFGDTGNLTMTKPIPAEIVSLQNDLKKAEEKQSSLSVQDTSATQGVFVYQTATTHSALKLQQKRTDQGDSKSENPELASSSDARASSTKVNRDVELKASVDFIKYEETPTSDMLTFIKDVRLRDDVKSEPNESIMSRTSMDVDEDKGVDNNDLGDFQCGKKSVLCELLDMSDASVESGIDDKSIMAKIDSNTRSIAEDGKNVQNTSSESLFFIRKDSDEESQTTNRSNINQLPNLDIRSPEIENRHSPALEYKEEILAIIPEIKRRLSEYQEACDKISPPKNRHYEKVLSPNLNSTKNDENINKSYSLGSKSFQNANDTRELLDMLSNLTDKTKDDIEKDDLPGPVPAIEKNSEVIVPKRLSYAPNRRSIVLSREDLLSSISMAHAVLQKSRIELEDANETEDTNVIPTEHSLLKKSGRKSNEVVKTLHFEDESLSESNIKCDVQMTPLKKTAFGETSYMKESKAKVIPSYLKDVSDGIKELMLDLVKPMADVLPYEAAGLDRSVKKTTSTCSTQIQANIVTSSQIDIDTEVYSNTESVCNMSSNRSGKIVTKASEKSFEVDSRGATSFHRPISSVVPEDVLVFDPNNPLNNIHLVPMDYTDAHTYNPNESAERMSYPSSSDRVNPDREYEVERVSMQYNKSRLSHGMEGDACSDNVIPFTVSITSKTLSIDQSVDVKVMEVKDIEVNTMIAMKGNKELLQASSSLTLVDDAVTNSPFDADLETKTSQDSQDVKTTALSPVQVIYKNEEQVVIPEKLVKDEIIDTSYAKARKRNYSPTVRDKCKPIASADITPKPNKKMQKLSKSPNVFKAALDMHHASEATLIRLAAGQDITQMDVDVEKSKGKKSPKKSKPMRPTYTVQQAITEYVPEKMVVDILKSDSSSVGPKTQSDSEDYRSIDVISSNASAKVLEVRGVSSVSASESSRIDWHPELINELSSKNLVTECESGVNVVAKIDMLPFMGSHECEWESSSADTWTFRLLHARLRLSVRLTHQHGNEARSRVRADTPVHDIAVEIIQEDKKNPVAALCVRFACETMRYMCGRVTTAGGVPALLRRAAAVARVALRWARAMHDARAHLAYALHQDGTLALKVANIPLRSVWEVSLRVELVVENAREAPWPRAGDVRVTRVFSDVHLPRNELARILAAVPRDWGHAPRTIWRVFKYLKHKTRGSDTLLGMG